MTTPSDKNYIKSLSDALWELQSREFLIELKRLLVAHAGDDDDSCGKYAAKYAQIISFYHWFERSPYYASDETQVSKTIVDIFNAIRPQESGNSGKKKIRPLIAWFIHCCEPAARDFFEKEAIALHLAEQGLKFRPLENPPRIFSTWTEYAEFRGGHDAFSETTTACDRQARFTLPLDRPEAIGVSSYRTALDMRFTNRVTKFTGRSDALSQLECFLASAKPLLWWQIAGEAGQGKSRLALHVVDKFHGHQDTNGYLWEAGFLRDFSSDTIRELTTAPLQHNTLIVVDYVASAERSTAFSKILDWFAQRTKPNGPKIRMLVLERQPYQLNTDPDTSPTGWQEDVVHSHLGEVARRSRSLVYSDASPLVLGDPPVRDLITIANDWARSVTAAPLTPAQMEFFKKALAVHPSELNASIERKSKEPAIRSRYRRPLFAIIAAEAAIRGDSKSERNHKSFEAILKTVLYNEERELLGPEYIKTYQINRDPDEQSKRKKALSTLTNIVGSVFIEDTRKCEQKHLNHFDLTDDGIRVANLLLGRRVSVDSIRRSSEIKAREPDLLAEFQVVEHIRQLYRTKEIETIEAIVQSACSLNLERLQEFSARICEDFPHHEGSKALLEHMEGISSIKYFTSSLFANTLKELGYAGNLSEMERVFLRNFKESRNSKIEEVQLALLHGANNVSYHFARKNKFRKSKFYLELGIKISCNISRTDSKLFFHGNMCVNYLSELIYNPFASVDSIKKSIEYIDTFRSFKDNSTYSSFRLWILNNLCGNLYNHGFLNSSHEMLEFEIGRLTLPPAVTNYEVTVPEFTFSGGRRVSYLSCYPAKKITVNYNFTHPRLKIEAAFALSLLCRIHLDEDELNKALRYMYFLIDIIALDSQNKDISDAFALAFTKFMIKIRDLDDEMAHDIFLKLHKKMDELYNISNKFIVGSMYFIYTCLYCVSTSLATKKALAEEISLFERTHGFQMTGRLFWKTVSERDAAILSDDIILDRSIYLVSEFFGTGYLLTPQVRRKPYPLRLTFARIIQRVSIMLAWPEIMKLKNLLAVSIR